jgi:hypothetical protein
LAVPFGLGYPISPGRDQANVNARISIVTPEDDLSGPGRELQHLVGLTTAQAMRTATEEGITNIRVLQSVDGVTITVMSADRLPTRLNLVIEEAVVVKAVFG